MEVFKLSGLLPNTVKKGDKVMSTKRFQGHIENEESVPLTAVVYTGIFAVFHVIFNVCSTWYVRKTNLHVFFAWMQCCFAVMFCWRRRRFRNFFALFKNMKTLPAMCLYVVFVTINESSCNKATTSGSGSEVLQLGLATSPLFIIIGMLWVDRRVQPSLIMVFVTIASLIMTVVVCSEDDPYLPFKFTLSSGILGLLHGIVFALLVLYFKSHLAMEEASIFQLIFSMNLAGMICLPFVVLITGELDHLLVKGLPGGWYFVLSTGFILGILRVLDQASSLYQIKHTSCLLHASTRGFSWIAISLISIFTLKLELLISSFLSFWLVGAIFLAVVVDHLTDINS